MAEQPLPSTSLHQEAMRSGLLLGGWGVAGVFTVTYGLLYPTLTLLAYLLLFGAPVFAWWNTRRYTRNYFAEKGFVSFSTAFSFSSLMGIYAMLWVLVAVFFVVDDTGTGLFTKHLIAQIESEPFQAAMKQNEMFSELRRTTNGKEVQLLIESARSFHRADALTVVLFTNLLLNPLLSMIIGLLCSKSRQNI